MGYSIIILIIGMFLLVLGWMVKKYKMGAGICWVDLKKYDNDKVADIMGSHTMVFGIGLIIMSAINYVLGSNYQTQVVVTVVLLGILTEIGGYYRVYKYAKIED